MPENVPHSRQEASLSYGLSFHNDHFPLTKESPIYLLATMLLHPGIKSIEGDNCSQDSPEKPNQ